MLLLQRRAVRALGITVALSLMLVQGAGVAKRPSFKNLGSVKVSTEGGLGQIETHGKLAAVVQRDEAVITLLDITKPASPRILSRYDDGVDTSTPYDGDLAFSSDGRWLFWARQSAQFEMEGVHVLDVSEPRSPRLASYQPQGGTLRVAYHRDGEAEWVISLDATHGLVVSRFLREAGILVPVSIDPLPLTRQVGGAASAGLFIDDKDPMLGKPLLYASTGGKGLSVFDFSAPEQPRLLGSWAKVGLADVEVVATRSRRIVYAATEYWFTKSLRPEVIVLDASKLGSVKEIDRWGLGVEAADSVRVQGITRSGNMLLVAHSERGLVAFDHRTGKTVGSFRPPGGANPSIRLVTKGPYAMDVEVARGTILLSDAATGRLTTLRRGR